MQALTRRATRRLSKRKDTTEGVEVVAAQGSNLLRKKTPSRDGLLRLNNKEMPSNGNAAKTKKTRFSLKDVARKLLLKLSAPEANSKSFAKEIHVISSPSEGSSSTRQPSEPQTNGTYSTPIENRNQAAETIGEELAVAPGATHQRGISMTSTLTTLSNNSGNIRLSAALSPPPAAPVRPTRQPSHREYRTQFPDGIEILFEGAPTFCIDESNGIYGEPTVRYMDLSSGGQEHSLSFCEDAKAIDHEAFRTCSNKRKVQSDSPIDEQHHWLVGPSETPSMLSAFGQEPGSTGWQYFLETQMVDFELELGNRTGEIDEYGLDLQAPDSIGVRSIDSTTMIDRLRYIARYHELGYQLQGDFETEERSLYGQLFTQLLYPAKRNSGRAEQQDHGLGSQCCELFKILEERRVWLDFSRPEERIRLGSILYGAGEEKLLLVLQILLSCELWLRLKILHHHSPRKLELESLYFTQKVNWDLAVAQKWLTNVRIVERPYTPDFEMLTPVPIPQKTSNWHNFFLPDETRVEDAEEPQDADTYDAYFIPQHLERQLNGLLFFARKINWPGIEMLEGVIRDKLRETAGLQTPSIAYRTPATSPGKLTPRSVGGTGRSSYFGYVTNKHTSSAIVRNMGQGGWLSRTYNTGMILPGEGLSHLLMGCLLENDTLALNEIGEQGSMYGGIIRRTLEASGSTASWWSTNNVVGKVLATHTSPQSYAGWVGKCVGIFSSKGTTFEDMAHMSAVAAKVIRNFSLNTPKKPNNGMKLVEPIGWVDVVTNRKRVSGKMPRLSKPGEIEAHSNFKGLQFSPDQRLGLEEFQFPRMQPEETLEVQVLGLKFWDNVLVSTPSLPELEKGYYYPKDQQPPGDIVPAYRVEVVFKFPHLEQNSGHLFDSVDEDVVGVLLTYDVSFITSYPCKPGTSSNPSSTLVETGHPEFRIPERSNHPLHSSYRYKAISLRDLPSHTVIKRDECENENDYFVTVVNAMGVNEGLYVYAKAWCAKWGTDAVVSRPSRTCLSCAIREASALGIDVVICVGED